MTYRAYNDEASRRMVAMFRERLAPLMAEVAPDWLLHHIELRRDHDSSFRDQVEIRLVIRPIGEANAIPEPRELPGAHLAIPHR